MYLYGFSMQLFPPHVFQHIVHGTAVVKLLFERDTLAGHLNADEHVQ